MISKQKIFELLDKIDQAGLNNPIFSDYVDEIIELLGDDSVQILIFLNSLDNERLYDMTQVFGDLAYKFNTQEFGNELLRLEKKAVEADIEAYQRIQGGRK